MRRQIRDGEEGGALVEFALSTLLIVPVALYAMYVGEAYTASMKAQEAEIAASWEVSAYRLHAYTGGSASGLYSSANSNASRRVLNGMRDLDSFDTGAAGPQLPMSSSTMDKLECKTRNGPKFGAGLGEKYLQEGGYVGCRAEVTFRNHFIPRDTLKDVLHGGPALLASRVAELKLCGLGASASGCGGTGGLMLLTDDYGLEKATPNPVGGSDNQRYFKVSEAIYKGAGNSGAGAAAVGAAMQALIGTGDQGQTSSFKMGYLANVREDRDISPHHGGSSSAHLTPLHEEQQPAFSERKGISREVYGKRVEDNYLGQRRATWNAQ